MNWFLVAIAGWVLVSVAFALVIGHSIRLSDRRAHGQVVRPEHEPNVVIATARSEFAPPAPPTGAGGRSAPVRPRDSRD